MYTIYPLKIKSSTATIGIYQQSFYIYYGQEFKLRNKLKKHIGDKYKKEYIAAIKLAVGKPKKVSK
jgi:hypothetical protein